MPDFYGTADGYRAYFTLRGATISEDDEDAEIEAALLIASEYIDGRYLSSFQGFKVGQRAQVREWPRTGAMDFHTYPVPSDSVPREVEKATYEAAYRHMTTPGVLFLDYTPNKYKRVSVDGAVSVEFAQFNAAFDMQKQFPLIDQIMFRLIGGTTSSILSGASVRA